MKAHKVPGTYYSGWKITGFNNSFYVFYKADTTKRGIMKKFRGVDKITTEHSFFMDEDFYCIDMSIKGIEYKLKTEIDDFISSCNYTIVCEDDLNEHDGAERNMIRISDYHKYMAYKCNIDAWDILDIEGNSVSVEQFENELNDYISNTIGMLIEQNYFANYLEPKWNFVKESLKNDVYNLKDNDAVNISRKNDFLEFFVVQYLRHDERIKEDILPTITMAKALFKEMMGNDGDYQKIEEDGLLSEYVFFYGALIDAAKTKTSPLIAKLMQKLDMMFKIDVLQSISGKPYLTSSNPCVITKIVNKKKEEIIFPIDSSMCVRLKAKTFTEEKGKYILQSDEEVKAINRDIINGSNNIVMSNQEYIIDLI